MPVTQNPQTPPAWLQKMADNRERSSYLLIAAGAVFALVPLWLLLKYRGEYLSVALLTLLLAIVPAGAGLWNLLRLPGREREIDIARMLALIVGGLSGLLLVLTSAALVYHWWDAFNGLKTLQGAESWRVWVALIVLLAGLAAMFVSLQIVRTEERSSATLRRMVYGYNAVLTGVLLLAVLAVTNVLAYVHLSKPYDWTSQSIYSLSSKSENILANLKKPTKVYAILAHGGEGQRRVQALLENCQAVNPKIEVEYLSPDLNRETVKRLAEKYNVAGRDGLLVVHGTAPQEEHQFINYEALYNTRISPMSQSGDSSRFFKGESELMTTLSFLGEGKQKPVMYFTQGNGELDLNDMSAKELNAGMGLLKRRLEEDNYNVKGLVLNPVEGAPAAGPDVVSSVQVPADAAAVIVAGPKRPFTQHAIEALRKYMLPDAKDSKETTKGKLVVLFDQTLNAQKDQLLPIGLEDLLGQFNVQVGKERVLAASRLPLMILAATITRADMMPRNPVAAAFADSEFQLYDTRTVRPKTDISPENSRYKPETLLYAIGPNAVWEESDFRTPAEDWVIPEKREELKKKRLSRSLPVGVVVTEDDAARDPHQPAGGNPKPRMAVIGSPTPVSNVAMRNPFLGRQYDLFQSILGWLRDKPADIGIEAKKQDVYIIASNTNFSRLLYLPIFMMVFGVAGLGVAVWVVRRK